jgi:hypothetical protein
MTRSRTQARYRLIRSIPNPRGAGFVAVPTEGAQSLMQPQSRQSIRRLMTVQREVRGNFTSTLNDDLLGGESYPILNFALGTAAGVVSGGAGLLFAVATLALDLSRTVQRVLARGGDELWQVEEIGRAEASGLFASGQVAVHIGAYFLYDPFRHGGSFESGRGWLIHEARTELTLI